MDAEKINRPTQRATDERNNTDKNVFKLVESVLYEHGRSPIAISLLIIRLEDAMVQKPW
jgi:hypothetical protein